MLKLKTLLRFNKVFLIITFLIVIYVFINLKVIGYASKYSADTNNISGIITGYALNGDKISFDIKGKEKLKGTYYCQTLDEKNYYQEHLCLGCSIKITGTLKMVNNNTIPNTFNYQKYLKHKQIYWQVNISEFTIEEHNNLLYKIKDFFYKKTSHSQNADYLKIFLLGDKSLISSEEYGLFQTNGVAHLLAISGMHIGVFLKILDILLQRIKYSKKVIIIASILLFYAFLTSFAPSIMRAVLFYILLNIKKIFNLRISNLRVLLYTAYILILLNPFIIFDVGFLYSFVITGGIILNSSKIKGNYFKQLLILSIFSFLFSLPITVNLNYEINLTSIIANLIFVPYVSLIVYPMALLTFIFSILDPIFNFLIIGLNYLNTIFSYFSWKIVIAKIPSIGIIIYYVFLLLSFRNKKYIYALGLLLLILKIIPKLDSNFYIYYLDVGQGDAAIIISPHQRKVLMLDTGGKVEFSKDDWQKSSKSYNLSDNYLKFLKSLGIRKLDYLVLSHGDFDHMGESNNIINNFKVKQVIFNCGPSNELEQNLIANLKAQKISYSSCINTLDFAKTKFYFLNKDVSSDENTSSSVVYFTYHGFKFLFMGDAPKSIEEELIQNYNLKNITALKVGHHGSNTSSSQAFINAINPTFAIISVGLNNRYGHPNSEVLANLKNQKIYRTDLNGTIAFKIKNQNLNVTTYTS